MFSSVVTIDLLVKPTDEAFQIHIVELNPTPLQGRDSFHSIKVFNDKILIL